MTATFDLQLEKPTPTYLQIFKELKGKIASRTLIPGSRLPDERDLARRLTVSRGTLRRALAQLQQEGYLIRHQGRGTYVADQADLPALPVALVFQNIRACAAESYFGRLLEGIAQAGKELGAEVLLLDHPTDAAARHTEPAAAIFLAPHDPQPLIEWAAAGRPAVSMDLQSSIDGVDSVVYDNHAGGRQMTQRLIEWGHRHIVYIDGKFDRPHGLQDSPNSLERRDGYFQAMRDADIGQEEVWVMPLDIADVRKAVAEKLRGPARPTAIFCVSADVALGVWMAASQAGLRVPEDLSIATVCEQGVPAPGGVVWTCMGIYPRQMGELALRQAVAKVRRRIDLAQAGAGEPDIEAGTRVVVPHQLIEGETAGPAPQA